MNLHIVVYAEKLENQFSLPHRTLNPELKPKSRRKMVPLVWYIYSASEQVSTSAFMKRDYAGRL